MPHATGASSLPPDSLHGPVVFPENENFQHKNKEGFLLIIEFIAT